MDSGLLLLKFQEYDVAPVELLLKLTIKGAQPLSGVAVKLAASCPCDARCSSMQNKNNTNDFKRFIRCL